VFIPVVLAIILSPLVSLRGRADLRARVGHTPRDRGYSLTI
jgi:hypothetical protein